MTADELCERYADRVYRFAAMVSRSSADARDLAQEALERAIRGLPKMDPERGDIEGWLYHLLCPEVRSGARRCALPGSSVRANPRSVGLDGSSLIELSVSTTSDAHTLHLVRGYADPVRTVVFVQVDGRPFEAPSKTSHGFYLDGTLTDQFGHTYHQVCGGAQGAASTFEPLVLRATAAGARLTLHVTALMPTGYGDSTVKGDWSLRFTLTQQPGRLLDPPAPLQVGYTFTKMQVSGDLFELNWSISGGAVTRMHPLVDGYYGRNPTPPRGWSTSKRVDLTAPHR